MVFIIVSWVRGGLSDPIESPMTKLVVEIGNKIVFVEKVSSSMIISLLYLGGYLIFIGFYI